MLPTLTLYYVLSSNWIVLVSISFQLSHHLLNSGGFPSIVSILCKCRVVNLKGKDFCLPMPMPCTHHKTISLFVYILYIYFHFLIQKSFYLYRQCQKFNCRSSINFQHEVLWIMIILKCPTVLMHKNCFPKKRNNHQDCHFFLIKIHNILAKLA